MIHHLVWFKLSDDIQDSDVEQLKTNLLEMPAQIPQIVSLSCGRDFSGRARGFEFGLSVQFHTREDGQLYDKHPAHQEFIAKSKHFWRDVMALDFEV